MNQPALVTERAWEVSGCETGTTPVFHKLCIICVTKFNGDNLVRDVQFGHG